MPGAMLVAEELSGGHINRTFRITCAGDHGPVAFLLQCLNPAIFAAPDELMSNAVRVTQHVRAGLLRAGLDSSRRVLSFVAARQGGWLHRDTQGHCWRAYRYIPARVQAELREPADAETAAHAFGEFQRRLVDLPAPRLHETLPGFHDTPQRYAALERAAAVDECGRVAHVAYELDFARARRAGADLLISQQRAGVLPERVVHNDAKLSNVLLDEQTGAALAVVDLDTVMPGLALYDFGDMVRSMACRAPEDAEASRMAIDPELFAALSRGYLAEARTFLTPAERELLVPAGRLITLEQGVRFLTDYLCGDRYYRTQRATQNLERARAQFALVESLERQSREFEAMIAGA
jgi:Ser/Thr protein kinase RdoA (MazF antagonist)